MAKASGWHRVRTDTAAYRARRAKYNSAEHKAARKHYAAWIAAGNGRCWRCLLPIPLGSEWHVGHSDDGRTIMGAEHASCNKGAAASKGARVANAKRKAREFVRPVR